MMTKEAILLSTFLIALIMSHTISRLNTVTGSDATRSFQIFIWNVRGAGSQDFLNTLKEHICLYRPDILVLIETHISGSRAEDVCSKLVIVTGFESRRKALKGYLGPVEPRGNKHPHFPRP